MTRKIIKIQAYTNESDCKIMLDDSIRKYRDELMARCKSTRRKMSHTKKSNAMWDMPKVLCACGKVGNDIVVREYCRKTISKKDCHPKLMRVLPGPLDSNYPQRGMKISGLGFRVGHCAEPHAANALLKKTNCEVNRIIFSNAIGSDDGSVRNYCITCKATFKQLK